VANVHVPFPLPDSNLLEPREFFSSLLFFFPLILFETNKLEDVISISSHALLMGMERRLLILLTLFLHPLSIFLFP